MSAVRPDPRQYRTAKLPFWMRFEWGNDAACVNLICSCDPKAEPQSMLVRPEIKDSSVEFRCRYCGKGFQFRAFREIEQPGPAAGEGRKS